MKRFGVAMAGTALIAAAGLTLGAQTSAGQSTAPARREPPKLVVLFVVDQFRADYVQSYGSNWKAGLRRLLDTGAYFREAAFPYIPTFTCVGHTTIGTGAYPKTHGMIGNTFVDRAAGKVVACTDDPAGGAISFEGRPGLEREGPRNIMTTTFADELRKQAAQPPAIVSMSLKSDAAIGMVGHAGPGTVALWKSGNAWVTSTAYASAAWPDVAQYVRSHGLDLTYGQVWKRMLPDSAYQGPDDAPGELMPRKFPHILESQSGLPDSAYVSAWARSPWSDAYLADLAAMLVEKRQLGRHAGTDMLAVSFSALDLVGHAFGPSSHEVQDLLARLDVTMGKLLDRLDKMVGPNQYIVGLSADHGVAPLPEQVTGDAGRLNVLDVARRLDAALAPAGGTGSRIGARPTAEMNFVLAPGVYEKVIASPELRSAAERAVLGTPGVWKVYWADQMASTAPTDDPVLQAARLGYMAGRSGDLIVLQKPNWIATSAGTTHGSYADYDRRVPLILAGPGIKPGEYTTAASPADLAPTFAFLTGVTLTHVDGRVLTEAMVK